MSDYTPLELLAHDMCDNYPPNKAEGWNWRNISEVARIAWLISAHDQLLSESKAQALEEAADRLEASDKPWESPLYESTILWLRASAQRLKEEA